MSAQIRRYILFHQKRHPNEMASAEIEAFLKQRSCYMVVG